MLNIVYFLCIFNFSSFVIIGKNKYAITAENNNGFSVLPKSKIQTKKVIKIDNVGKNFFQGIDLIMV